MNSLLAKLEPAPVWRLFDAICAIPHPSGHETRLAAALAALAEKNGLAVRIDVTGNLRIDRPASPGFEDSPMILLQGHLDMVPQALATVDFDFTREPIPLTVEDGWVRSAAGTTLGSDDGIGVAAAMALLLDPELKCGPLAGVFTVSEEVGLNGALALSAEFLKGDFLLNLDSEEEGQLYIGCAGGARLEIDVELPQAAVPPGYTGLCCEIKNLAGGHSGVDIHLRRGNAVAFLARLLEKLPEFEVAALSGGTLDNVIPREAVAFGAADPARLAALRLRAANRALEFAREFDAPPDFAVELRPAVLPERVWERSFREKLVALLATCPNGVRSMDRALDVVRTSTNLAAVKTDGAQLKIRTSQRSLVDAERQKLTDEIAAHFVPAGGRPTVDNSYPGWEPDPESELLRTAESLYRELFGTPPQVKVIHAGLECGILAGINPALQMISFGPTLIHPHSPSEKLNIASVGRFYEFLRKLVSQLQIPPEPDK